jgi:hypothetical protein
MMSMSIPFDTLDYAKKLETAGMPSAQAEVQSKLLAEVLSKSVAFPGDLSTLEHNLTAKIEAVELRINANFKALQGDFKALHGDFKALQGEVNLGKWMLGTVIAMNVAILLKLFLH